MRVKATLWQVAKHSKQSKAKLHCVMWFDGFLLLCHLICTVCFQSESVNKLQNLKKIEKSKNQNQNPIKMDYERIQKPQVLAYPFMHFLIHWICCPFYLKRCRLGCARRRIFPRKVKEYAFGSRKEEKRRWWFWIQISTYSCSWIIIRYIFLLLFFFFWNFLGLYI